MTLQFHHLHGLPVRVPRNWTSSRRLAANLIPQGAVNSSRLKQYLQILNIVRSEPGSIDPPDRTSVQFQKNLRCYGPEPDCGIPTTVVKSFRPVFFVAALSVSHFVNLIYKTFVSIEKHGEK